MSRQSNTGEMSVSILDRISKVTTASLAETKDTNKNLLGILNNVEKILEQNKESNDEIKKIFAINSKKVDSSLSTQKLENIGTETNKTLTDILSVIRDKNDKSLKKSESGGKDLKEDFKAFGMLASSLVMLMQVANSSSPKAATNITTTLTSLINGLQPILGRQQELQKGAETLLILSSAISSFGKTMALATPLFIIGTVGAAFASLNIAILSYTLARIDSKKTIEGATAVKAIGYSVLIMGLSVAAFAMLVTPENALLTSISILAVAGAFYFIGAASKQISDGAKSLIYSGLSILSLGLGIAAFVALVENPINVLLVGLSVLVIGGAFYLLGKGAGEIAQGSLALMLSGLSIGILGYAIGYFKEAQVDLETIGMLGLSILTVGGSMFLAGKFAGSILMGSLAMILASIPVYMLASSLKTFKESEIDAETIGYLGLSLLTVGGGMALAGLGAPLIILGSIGMMLAGGAIYAITESLKKFKELDFTEDDSKNLNFAMSAVRVAFTGGDGAQGGILSSIGGFFSSIFDGVAMVANAASMMLAGAAISTISLGLADFKKISWTESDSQTLTSVFSSVIKSFSLISDKKLQKEFGIDISPLDIYFGIESLSNAGNTITSLAKGVQSFANLSFDEYTYDKASKKLIVTGKTKMADTDIVNAGINISKVIATVGSAFADVGRLERGESSENSLLSLIFGGGFVSLGVSALADSGRTISQLATGVKDFANLSFTEYEAKDGKIVPIKVSKLSSADIDVAGQNISRVISTVGAAFAEVGKLDAGETSNDGILSAIFGGGGQLVRRGVEALAGSGKLIIDLGQGVKDFANLTLTQYEVQDVNGLPTIVPVKVTKMNDTDFDMATANISRVVSTVAKVFADVGRINAGESSENSLLHSIFGTGLVQQGVESLNGVGGNLIAIAEAIPKYANLQFVKMGVKDINGVPTVVPLEFVTITQPDLTIASLNISKILGLVAASFAEVGKMAVEGSGWFADGYIAEGVTALQGVGENLSGIVDSVLKVATMQMPVYGSDGKITNYVTLKDTDLTAASINIRKILGLTAETFSQFGAEYGESGDKYESLKEGMKIVEKVSSSYGKSVEGLTTKITESANIEATVMGFANGMRNLTTTIFEIFDTNKDAKIIEKTAMFDKFVFGIGNISGASENLTKAATSFEKMATSMKVFKDSVNSLDLKKAGLADSIFASLAALANVKGGIDNLARTLDSSIKASFDKIVELLESMNTNSEIQTQNTANLGETVSTTISSFLPPSLQPKTSATTPTPTTDTKTQTPPPMNAQQLTDIDATLRSILSLINRAISENTRR